MSYWPIPASVWNPVKTVGDIHYMYISGDNSTLTKHDVSHNLLLRDSMSATDSIITEYGIYTTRLPLEVTQSVTCIPRRCITRNLEYSRIICYLEWN